MSEVVFSARLLDEANIFSVEAKAIELAFEHIKILKYTFYNIFVLIFLSTVSS